MISKANMTLRNSLMESLLFEDDAEAKKKSFMESVKKWVKDVKDKLSSIVKTFKEKIMEIINKVKPVKESKKVPSARANAIKQLTGELNKLEKEIAGASRVDGVLEASTKKLESVNEADVEKTKEILAKQSEEAEAKAEKIREQLRKTSILDKNFTKASRDNEKETLNSAVFGSIFKTYYKIVKSEGNRIKNYISLIGVIAKADAKLRLSNTEEPGKIKRAFAAFAGYVKAAGMAFKNVAVCIAVIVRTTAILVKVGVVELAKKVGGAVKGGVKKSAAKIAK